MAALHDLTEGVNIIEEEEQTYQTGQDGSSTLLLSSGVVLEHTDSPPSRMIITNIINRYEYPDPPMAEMGKGRLEENPNHPDYVSAVAMVDTRRAFAFYDACIVLGTRIVSVPEHMERPEGVNWYEEMEILGFELDRRPKGLYLSWIRYYAANTEEDMKRIMTFVLGQLGASEEQIRTEFDKFPDN